MEKNREDILYGLMQTLPSIYNSESTDTNYYKLLKALSYSLEEIHSNIDEVYNNFSIDTATGEALYNNYGVLVDLRKNPKISYDRYRDMLKGVIKSFVNGPTKNNIDDATKTFTRMQIEIYELYKDEYQLSQKQELTVNKKYAFAVDITKTEEINEDVSAFFNELRHFITKVRPAHTIMLFTLKYKMSDFWWEDKSRNIDHLSEAQLTFKEHKYGYIIDERKILKLNTFGHKINSDKILGPAIYILKDQHSFKIQTTCTDEFKKPIDETLLRFLINDEDHYDRKIDEKFMLSRTAYEYDEFKDSKDNLHLVKIQNTCYDSFKRFNIFKLNDIDSLLNSNYKIPYQGQKVDIKEDFEMILTKIV